MPDVNAGWIHAIDSAQKVLRKGGIKIPVLLMHSDKSAHHGDGPKAYSSGDGVLDVRLVAKAGRRLGGDVTEVTIEGGLHDLVLSRAEVREKVYNTIFEWLKNEKL